MALKIKGLQVIASFGLLCVIVFGIMTMWRKPIINPYEIIGKKESDNSHFFPLFENKSPSREITFQDRKSFTKTTIYQKLKNVEKQKTISASFLDEKASKKVETLPQVFTYRDNLWQKADICKPYRIYQNRTDFPLVRFSSQAGTTRIYVHSVAADGISSIIKRTGAFEVGTINRIIYELQKDSRLNLIDIGTNVGQHSIAAALIGREAMAMDCAKANIEHLCATVQYLNFNEKITMVYNIISDTNEKRQVRYSPNNDHFGNTYVESDGIGKKMMSAYKKGFFSDKTVEEDAVSLDDMLSLPQMERFKRVFIKLDVEGHEHRVLQGGMKFFKTIHISGIIMEWAWHKNRQTANLIISLMKAFKFKPYEIHRSIHQNEIDISYRDPNTWPQDVLWLPVK